MGQKIISRRISDTEPVMDVTGSKDEAQWWLQRQGEMREATRGDIQGQAEGRGDSSGTALGRTGTLTTVFYQSFTGEKGDPSSDGEGGQ